MAGRMRQETLSAVEMQVACDWNAPRLLRTSFRQICYRFQSVVCHFTARDSLSSALEGNLPPCEHIFVEYIPVLNSGLIGGRLQSRLDRHSWHSCLNLTYIRLLAAGQLQLVYANTALVQYNTGLGTFVPVSRKQNLTFTGALGIKKARLSAMAVSCPMPSSGTGVHRVPVLLHLSTTRSRVSATQERSVQFVLMCDVWFPPSRSRGGITHRSPIVMSPLTLAER
jgi:hypothetical protein